MNNVMTWQRQIGLNTVTRLSLYYIHAFPHYFVFLNKIYYLMMNNSYGDCFHRCLDNNIYFLITMHMPYLLKYLHRSCTCKGT
jgi:hypothetical protein